MKVSMSNPVRWITVFLVMLSITVTGVVLPTPAHAVQSFNNAGVADAGLAELGTSRATGWNQPGECIKSVQRWVAAAGGYFGPGGVVSGYVNSGAEEISLTMATKGDVVQYTNGNASVANTDWTYVHTVVIITNHGIGKFDIVQSNSPEGSGLVTRVNNWAPAPHAGWVARVWRFGTVASAPAAPLDGTLLQVENTGSAWAAYDVSNAAEKKYTRGTPGVLWSTTGPNVFAADTNGALRQFTTCSNGIGWCSYVILANGALGTGGVSVAHSGSAIEVFAVTEDGTLLQVENPGNGWSVYNISQAVGNVKIKGSPSVIWGPTGPNVFAIDTNGALRQFTLCPGGGWCKYTLTADNTFAGGVSATMNGSAIEVFARSTGNHLYQVEFTNGAWSVYDVTNFAEGVQIKGTPGVLWTSSGPSVYAADSNGALRQFTICSGGSSWCTFKILNDGALGDGAGVDAVHTGSAIEVFASTQ